MNGYAGEYCNTNQFKRKVGIFIILQKCQLFYFGIQIGLEPVTRPLSYPAFASCDGVHFCNRRPLCASAQTTHYLLLNIFNATLASLCFLYPKKLYFSETLIVPRCFRHRRRSLFFQITSTTKVALLTRSITERVVLWR